MRARAGTTPRAGALVPLTIGRVAIGRLGLVLLAALLVPPSLSFAGDLTAEEARWARDLVEAVGSNSPRVRQGAEQALAGLGVDALPVIVEAWAEVKSEATRKGLRRVMEGMGRESVVTALERMRHGLSKAQSRRIDDLLTDFAGTVASGAPATVPLVPGTLESPSLAPLGAEARVEGRLPFVPGTHVAIERPGGLSIDADGDGREETSVAAGGFAVVAAGRAEGRAEGGAAAAEGAAAARPLLVYAKRGTWYACSASLLRARQGKVAVELLDADLDGTFDGAKDWLRVGDGAFGPRHAARQLPADDGPLTYEVRREGGGFALALASVPRPATVDALAWTGLLALNRYRATLGLAPATLDLVRSEACRQHARYLAMNAGSAETAGLGAHHQNPAKPGYTREGAEAAGSSIVSSHGDPGRAVASCAATMLHRTDLLGEPATGFGIGVVAGGKNSATVVWGEDWTARGSAAPLVVPAPGQRRVPLRGGPEEPPPDDPPGWYAAPRGYPVSIHYGGLALTEVQIRLYVGDSPTPVAGRTWTPEQPIRPGYGGGAAFFMPAAPLEAKRAYTAEVTATLDGRPAHWVWEFRTD